MTTLRERTIASTEEDKRMARESSQVLESIGMSQREVRLQFLDEDARGTAFSVPMAALRLLKEILKEMARGNAVTLIPVDAMLTTQEAADILNVSRPFLIRLLEAGKIPYQRLGSHRRILFKDLMAFKEKADAARADAMRQLTQEAQELDMGY